ncbi:MAG: DNA modification methylase [Bryobacteraceae bacterium]|jgi:DNA modification methylase
MKNRRSESPKADTPFPVACPDFTVEMWPIDKPIDYPKNARKWTQQAIDKVAMSIREFGWRQPVVVDSQGVIVIGHLRRVAGKSIGCTECPVHVARDLSPEKIRALRLADNRTGEEATWDMDLLAAEFLDLKSLDIDLSFTAFDCKELDALLLTPNPAEDETPPVPEVPTSRLGDLWVMGGHRLLCGDCTKPEDVARLLADDKPGLMVTDPPYGIELDSEWRDRAGLNGCGAAEPSYMKHRTEGHTQTTISGDTQADWSEAFELVPSIQVAYVWHASIYTAEVLLGLRRIGFLYPQQIIWNKGRKVLTRTHYWYQHEPCWYVRRKNAPWFGKAGENSTIWDAASPKFIMGGSKDPADVKQDHPTQKPVELMRRSIVNHTVAQELVYEPFGGSGTTLVAAELTGRRCLCLELDPKYVDVIVTRWHNLTGKQAVLGDGDYKGATFEHVQHGRLLEWQDQIGQQAFEAEKPAAAGAGRAEGEGV